MPIAAAQTILLILGAYALLGVCFAIPFVTLGVGRVDAAARATPIAFRLLILPGVVALWPPFLVRWVGAASRRGRETP